MSFSPLVKNAVFFLICCACSFSTSAQLTANFTIDKTGGCSPLTVQFTNTTTGASANATYKWDLGNGNTSGLPSPGATYTQQKTYSITLTVTDGAKTSTQTEQVTVYKNPKVDFSATPISGCLPLDVAFTGTATPGDGTLSSYFWDFGDGQTQTGPSYGQTSHTYTFAQSAGVGLTVTNSYGCYTTTSKSGYISVSSAVTADFSASQTTLCQTNNQVSFANNSTGAGTLSYKWDFGDGQTSTSASPAHTYTTKGTYSVTLTTSSSLGCSNNTVKTDYINVANFSVDFTVPTPICVGDVSMTDISTANYNSTLWQMDGQPYYGYSTYNSIYDFYFTDTASHSIELTHTYGNCTVSKTKTVKANATPVLNGFVMNVKGTCTPPIPVTLSDTTKDGAVSWTWLNDNNGTTLATGKSATYSFPSQSDYYVSLKVENNAGCTAMVTQPLDLSPPNIFIIVNGFNSSAYSACAGVTLHFSGSPADVIKSYSWNFGDGTATDTSSTPSHKFSKGGVFTVVLTYTTVGGCTGSTNYGPITILDKPNFTFSAIPDSVVCGNTPVTFSVTPSLPDWFVSWDFGDYTTGGNYASSIIHQYYYDSVYTVSAIVENQGCADTIVKPKYITVKPDFPRIEWQSNTCDGTRGTVTFNQASTKVNKYIWNFGDGTSPVTYTSPVDTVYHTYTKSGIYSVVLTGINGACSVGDSVTTYVLLKQSPKLSSPQSSACGSDDVSILINNLDVNYAPNYSDNYYYISALQYGDLTPAPYPPSNFNYDSNTFSGSITGLNPGETQLRAITQSSYFGCFDTTNFIPLKIHGPAAGFGYVQNDVCFKSPIILKNSSTAGANVPIKSWQWSFGDGATLTENKGINVSHIYASPGGYQVSLTVTDTSGCTNTTTYNYAEFATVSGPQASFSVSQNAVPPNTTVYFYNNTNTYNAYDVSYTWLFPDGSQSQDYYPSYLFTTTGVDTVKLISSNNQLTCTDTAYQIIYVRTVNTAFTYTFSYINAKNCPPVIVTFTSTTSNATTIYWDFGDGSQGGNQSVVSHTYNNPGLFRVVLYGYDANNNLDSTVDFITVKGPYAILAANKLTGCDSLTVELSAAIKNASSFTWDFGDGTLKTSSDTFSVHQYTIPGIYTPQLILKDSGGCASTSALQNKIIVDDLTIAVSSVPTVICDSSLVYFNPTVASIAKDQLQLPLQYHWNFGTGNVQDTSNQASASMLYGQTGQYVVGLTVSSPYGCMQTVFDSITVQPVSRATITGPAEVCTYDTITFNATATNLTNNLGWTWRFFNNTNNPTQGQGPLGVYYTDSGTYNITLVVNNNGCYDTAYKALQVHGRPAVNILPQQPKVCLGSGTTLTAHNAQTYVWQPDTNISGDSTAAPVVSPVNSTWYYVHATNVYGCTTNDSVLVKVDAPFKLKTDSVLNICVGSTGQFNVSGADTYKWISGTGLSNTQIPNPVVTTTTPQSYTVVGYDNDGCFTDTANIQVYVMARPTISVAPHAVTINAGSDIQLTTQASADVITYAWNPTDYLSCANCAAPLSSPRLPVTYVVTATNGYGCTAADTAKIELLCAQDLIFIPNAFTPNNDNKNDRFVINGGGVRLIKHIVIYSRLGNKVFEKGNIGTDDYNNSWDGTVNSQPSPPGVYVYMAEIMCSTGEVYSYKGTIVLVR